MAIRCFHDPSYEEASCNYIKDILRLLQRRHEWVVWGRGIFFYREAAEKGFKGLTAILY